MITEDDIRIVGVPETTLVGLTFKEQLAECKKELLYKKNVKGIRECNRSNLINRAFPDRYVESTCGYYDTKRKPVKRLIDKIERLEALEREHLK